MSSPTVHYSLAEACWMLRCDRETFWAWAEREEIDRAIFARNPRNLRRLSIPHPIIEQLSIVHERVLRPLPPRGSRTDIARIIEASGSLAAVFARLDEITRRLEALETVVGTGRGNRAVSARAPREAVTPMRFDPPPAPAPVPAPSSLPPPVVRRPRVTTRPLRPPHPADTLPDGWIAFSTWCLNHHVNSRSVERAIEKFGKLPAPQRAEAGQEWVHIPPRGGRYVIATAYTPEQQAEAVPSAARLWPHRFRADGCPHCRSAGLSSSSSSSSSSD